ncbi:helix-turn-helix domain-containing protein [Yaniella halotolerans]|uniref:helix-turn-helix domain-containing protein n=1 Tax=Yaniella halotolerans TaxID=225453 RepID=UPI0012EB8020|nr:helix-turn-helix domain-containing protein [Yaniella halotolerans]
MPRRVKDFRGLTEESRVRLLHAVQLHPGQALKDLASEADVHVNTARDHLRVLEAEGFVVSAPVDTGRRGRPPMGYWPVERSEHSPAAQERAEEASARGELLRRLAPDRDHGQALEVAAAHQLDVLYEHLEDAGMDPVVNSDDLTVGVRPCIYQGLLESERPVVCSVHAKLVRQQLEQVDGPLKLRRLHPFTTAHSCLLVLDSDEQEPLVSEENAAVPGIAADRSDVELGEFALEAQRRAEDGSGGDGPSCPL